MYGIRVRTARGRGGWDVRCAGRTGDHRSRITDQTSHVVCAPTAARKHQGPNPKHKHRAHPSPPWNPCSPTQPLPTLHCCFATGVLPPLRGEWRWACDVLPPSTHQCTSTLLCTSVASGDLRVRHPTANRQDAEAAQRRREESRVMTVELCTLTSELRMPVRPVGLAPARPYRSGRAGAFCLAGRRKPGCHPGGCRGEANSGSNITPSVQIPSSVHICGPTAERKYQARSAKEGSRTKSQTPR
jgi:hypothetical protein